jgi:hypothetical protein
VATVIPLLVVDLTNFSDIIQKGRAKVRALGNSPVSNFLIFLVESKSATVENLCLSKVLIYIK